MTIETAELKSAALACDPTKCADEAEYKRRLTAFYSECEPESILALLLENEAFQQLEAAYTVKFDAYECLKAAISTPESVFLNMKIGALPKPAQGDMLKLYGEAGV